MVSYDEIMDEPCFPFAKEYLLFHTWISWKSYDSEIRIDHAEFVAMVETFFLRILHHDES